MTTASVPTNLVFIGAAGSLPGGETPPGDTPWDCIRLPATTDSATPWRERADTLLAQIAVWQRAPYVLLLDDDVQISAAAISELFRVMRQYDLHLAQPSLAWQSHFVDTTALHNPSFVLRYTNRLDSAALAFSGPMLRASLGLLGAMPQRNALSRLLPACQDPTTRGAAVIDAARAQRTLPTTDAEFADPDWQGLLEPAGPHHEPATCWGGVGLRGQRVSLFDETREEFLGLLTAGYACAVQEPQPIGEVFLQHFVRSLQPVPQAIQALTATAPTPTPRLSPIIDHTAPGLAKAQPAIRRGQNA